MTTEHDEALVGRVALALANVVSKTEGKVGYANILDVPRPDAWIDEARLHIYPPAPPKTRLQVARGLVSEQFRGNPESVKNILSGSWDTDRYMKAVLAALALDKMEE